MSTFNKAAATYDTDFSFTPIGQIQRKQVYAHLDKLELNYKDLNVLELGAGTGIDAAFFGQKNAHVLATDASEEMVRILNSKLKKYPKVASQQLKAQEVDKFGALHAFNMVFSNFGALNCLSPTELEKVLSHLENTLPPKSKVTFVLMGRFCLWEWAYFTLKGQFKTANRRNSKEAVDANVNGESVPTYYHSPSSVMKMVGSARKVRLSPIGWVIPPSYLGPLMKKHMLLFDICKVVEKIAQQIPVLAYSSDHYCITLET